MNKQEVLKRLKGYPRKDSTFAFEHPYAFRAGWRWVKQLSGQWEMELNGGYKPEDLITRRDWNIKNRGITQVLLDEALLEIKRLNERINEEVPRGHEMGS